MRISDWSSDVCSSDLLAIECDGDRYHGPEQWPADMQRQRTLERAGWRFWRCFASRFVREQQTVLEELCKLLDSLDIKPSAADKRSTVYTDYKRSEEHTSELHSLKRISYADFCL